MKFIPDGIIVFLVVFLGATLVLSVDCCRGTVQVHSAAVTAG